MTTKSLVGVWIVALTLWACGGGAEQDAYSPNKMGTDVPDRGGECTDGCGIPDDEGGESVDPGAMGDDGSGGSVQGGGGEVALEPGTLTAADWDDNLNFDFYLDYLDGREQHDITSSLPALPAHGRIVVRVADGQGKPIRDAEVTVSEGNNLLVSLKTGSDGRALFFPSLDGESDSYLVAVTHNGHSKSQSFTAQEGTWLVQLTTDSVSQATALDLALVIDTTGSMGDEIAYLQTELDWLISEVASQYPALDIRLGLVAYRDVDDAYEVKSWDFTGDVNAYLASLASLQANGGGDYPESLAEGLAEGMALDWRTTDAVRVAFLMADAPPQAGRNVTTVESALLARENAIRIFPVASSGVGDEAEWVFRQLAEFTFGRYLFLTDDSGVGGEHAEPHIPCYLVQKLNALMLRMIDSEIVGHRVYPTSEDVIRTSGDPEAGQCLVVDQVYYY